MAVRTVNIQPSIQTSSIAAQSAPKIGTPKKAAIPKQPAATKKAAEPKPKNIQAPAKTEGKAVKAKPLDSSVLEEMESHLASLEKKEAVFVGASSLPLPKTVQTLPKEEKCTLMDFEYGEVLVSFLQNALELPEFGEVVVDLDVDPAGRLIRFDIVEAKSKKNGDFLKKRLPELVLPCFNGPEKSYAVRNFTITFKNAASF